MSAGLLPIAFRIITKRVLDESEKWHAPGILGLVASRLEPKPGVVIEGRKMSSKVFFASILFCGFVGNTANAQNKFIKIGGTYSYLNEPSYGEPGVDYMYGIGKDWKLYRWIHLRTELLISNSSTLLKDRSVQSGSDLGDVFRSFPYLPNEATGYTDINYFDIDIQLMYLEIPLLLKVDRSFQKNLSIGLEIGYSLILLRQISFFVL